MIRSRGFTLVEVLVVLGIIGLLIAILAPAVQVARESARRGSCANNLKQQGLAIKLHESTHQVFPTGGWGGEWMGDPDRGFGAKQPGGWVYNVLPYLEQQNLRDLGRGQPPAQKQNELIKVLETPLVVFNCPSRRSSEPFPFTGVRQLKNVLAPERVAKSDYVMNRSISAEKSQMLASEIQLGGKGMSKTLLAGEKSVAAAYYESGESTGDQLAMYVGDCEDVAREVGESPVSDVEGGSGFGSSHPSGCNIVYCDGAVKFVVLDERLE